MMNIKLGTDICSISRIQHAYKRFGERFLDRILTAREKRYVMSQERQSMQRLAGRFAAKEAMSKALGTGWHGLYWKEIEVLRRPSGEPLIELHGRAIELAKQRQFDKFELSISHEREFAVATVVAYSSSA